MLLQVGVKNQFGYIKSKPESSGGKQQPPISRPVNCQPPPLSPLSPLPHQSDQIQSMPNLLQSSNMMQNMMRGMMADSHHQTRHHSGNPHTGLMEPSLTTGSLLGKRYGVSHNMNQGFSSTSQLSDLLSGASIADLANSSGLNPYEKWSNGSDSLFGNLTGPSSQADAFKDRIGLGQTSSNDSILDLSSKFMSQTCLSSPPLPPGTPIQNSSVASVGSGLYPLKSQIKRQKMIYHCKFGEFGILEGQFTEPSGVAVNAQNDIIVADTNNHRIQIFDKEGRFKFQFGEVGKRDGQLLYPNRVAVVKTSGDIIVTER